MNVEQSRLSDKKLYESLPESENPPTEKAIRISKNIIELMGPLIPYDFSDDVIGGKALYYKSEDKNREVWISIMNNNPDYPHILYSVNNPLSDTAASFSFHDIPHIKRFIKGYKEEDVYNNFYPKSHIWLNDIYSFVSENKNEEAMDLLFEKIGNLLDGQEFKEVNFIIQSINLRKLNVNLLVGLLCITRCGTGTPLDFLALYEDPSLLPYRSQLVNEIEKVLHETETNERVESLMSGLRK
jgi:hypothetical protein